MTAPASGQSRPTGQRTPVRFSASSIRTVTAVFSASARPPAHDDRRPDQVDRAGSGIATSIDRQSAVQTALMIVSGPEGEYARR